MPYPRLEGVEGASASLTVGLRFLSLLPMVKLAVKLHEVVLAHSKCELNLKGPRGDSFQGSLQTNGCHVKG